MNVYFIDDDHMTNRYHEIILEDIVQEKNIQLTFFREAKQALRRLSKLGRDKYPNYIFLDLNMPMMDGWEFLEHYNKMGLPKTKVIILTTSENPHHITKANTFDLIQDYLTKPLEISYFSSLKTI